MSIGPMVAIQIEATGARGVFEATKVDASQLRVVHVPQSFTGEQVNMVMRAAVDAIEEIVAHQPNAEPDR